jgi:predicted small lipoprotein YifL
LISRPAVGFARLAAIGALAAALGLAGCGRKAGLDPPPSASITEPGATQPGPVDQSDATPKDKRARPKGPHQPFFLDWLVD